MTVVFAKELSIKTAIGEPHINQTINLISGLLRWAPLLLRRCVLLGQLEGGCGGGDVHSFILTRWNNLGILLTSTGRQDVGDFRGDYGWFLNDLH